MTQHYPTMHHGILPDEKNKGHLVLQEINLLKPKPNELLIRVKAAGVNRADLEQAKGSYPPPPDASPILGLELSGIVLEVGNAVTKFKKGDRVMSLVSGGAYADVALAPEETTLPIPDYMSFIEAAAIPEAYFTIWHNVFEKGKFQAGEIFLVHGGASGVGSAAIQIIKAMGGIVIATVSTEQKKIACLQLGADYAINYKNQHFASEIFAVTDQQGIDVILDWIGADYLSDHLALLRKNGRLLCIDSHAENASLNFDLLLGKCLTITGTLLRPLPLAEKEKINIAIQKHLLPKLFANEIKPLIHCTFALNEVKKAHETLASSSHIGKVVLTTAIDSL